MVGHNVSYDIGILSSQLSRLNMENPKFIDYYDTLDIARRFYSNLPNHKLETLSNLFNTKTKSSHDAMDDILATKDVLINMVEEKIKPNLLLRLTVCSKYLNKFTDTMKAINELREKSYKKRPCDLIAEIVKLSNIKSVYEKEPSRIENIRELYLVAKDLDNEELSASDSLVEFLKITSLSNSELDRMLEKHPRVPIITVHQAKGSKFDYVFLAGLQDNLFPSFMSVKNNNVEEEERVFYVAMTRAKRQLFLSWSKMDGARQKYRSRLISHIPKEYILEE